LVDLKIKNWSKSAIGRGKLRFWGENVYFFASARCLSSLIAAAHWDSSNGLKKSLIRVSSKSHRGQDSHDQAEQQQ
jgi:hypothetical protein